MSLGGKESKLAGAENWKSVGANETAPRWRLMFFRATSSDEGCSACTGRSEDSVAIKAFDGTCRLFDTLLDRTTEGSARVFEVSTAKLNKAFKL